MTQNGKLSCGLKQRLIITAEGRGSHRYQENQHGFCEGGLCSSQPPHTQLLGPSTISAVFQVSGGPSLQLCKQCRLSPRAAEHPMPLGPGLFANNGGNVKQGLKTGSESLNSQTSSLEAEQQEGRGQMGGRVQGCSLFTPQ